jgi:hypothetical protein
MRNPAWWSLVVAIIALAGGVPGIVHLIDSFRTKPAIELRSAVALYYRSHEYLFVQVVNTTSHPIPIGIGVDARGFPFQNFPLCPRGDNNGDFTQVAIPPYDTGVAFAQYVPVAGDYSGTVRFTAQTPAGDQWHTDVKSQQALLAGEKSLMRGYQRCVVVRKR